MNITIFFQSSQPRRQVALHAWDQNGLVVHDQQPPLTADGLSFQFTISSTTADQREVSFKYQFDQTWEADSFIRTVPSTKATQLWTFDDSARCLTQAPGAAATFDQVTLHAITQTEYAAGQLYLWIPGTNLTQLINETSRDEAIITSTFTVPLADNLRNGFNFKLANDQDFEPDTANRVWRPSDGAEIWIKSRQVDVHSTAIVLQNETIDFLFPPALGTASLRIQDLAGDFDDTLPPATPPVPLDANLSRAQYTVSVYPASLYRIWWTTEPQSAARMFRLLPDGSPGDSAAISAGINGVDHWVDSLPAAANARVEIVVHPTPSSTFGDEIQLQAGIGTAAAHQTVTGTRQPDATWISTFTVLPGVPCWTAVVGESRQDGPLNFQRQFNLTAGSSTTLHTIDGVGGVSTVKPGPFQDAPLALRRQLMESVYGGAIVAAGVFDSWEMPHGTATANGHVYFVLRAPHSIQTSLLLLPVPNAAGTPRTVQETPMSLTADLRYWWCSVPPAQAPPGALYRFAYHDGRELMDPHYGEVIDPASRWVQDVGKLIVDAGTGAEQSWSMVADPVQVGAPLAGSTWRTAGWESLLVYEMHARRFTQRNAAAQSDFDQIAAELQIGGYLANLPVTALELLPVHEFPNDQGWGYNPSCFFAIDGVYGGPIGLARLARASHDAARALVLDVVFNHMMESPLQEIARDVYVSGETAWGDMVYYAHPATVEFFRQALVFLWRTFQVDGFRFDSTETIVNGGRDDTSSAPFILARGPDGKLQVGAGRGWEFLSALRTALRTAADASGQPWPFLVGENDPLNNGMTDPSAGVLDSEWWFPAMYALGNAAYNQDDHSTDVQGSLATFDQPYFRGVPYAESHDSVSGQNNQQRIVRRESTGNGRAMGKAVGAVVVLAEGVPMLFMGEEAGEDQPFQFGMLSTDPGYVLDLAAYEKPGDEPARVLAWFHDLMGLRNDPSSGLRGASGQAVGRGNKTVALSRAFGRFFLVATFGTPDQQQNLGWLGLPSGAAYKEIFNSSWPQYQVHSEPVVDNGGYAAQLGSGDNLRLPWIGAVVLERRS